MLLKTISLKFQGVSVNVITDDSKCKAYIESDFSQFLLSDSDAVDGPLVTILLSLSSPQKNGIPGSRRPWIKTKDATVYAWKGKRYLDSRGKVLVVLQFDPDRAEIYSLDRDLLREKAYLMIMSRVGEWLDRRGLHRIHAMGVVCNGRAVICALPMGGGKTTLTLGMMSHTETSLLSDEVPLVSRQGKLFGLPIRLGVREDTELAIPARYLSIFKRTNYAQKTLIDANYFAHKIVASADPGILLIGRRIDADLPRVEKIGSIMAFIALWQMCVLGRGVPQLREYIFRLRARAVLQLILTFTSRTIACVALVQRSKCYTLELGCNRAANATMVAELANNLTKRQGRS